MHIALAYIKFLLRSTNQHGVHSPFVYNLVTRCFYDRKKYPSYSLLKKYRKSLLKDNREVQVKDFGAGSRIFKSDKRKASEIAKNAGISPKRARLLNRLVRYLKIDSALELGTSLGLGTAAMAAGNEVRITTLEGCPNTAAIARDKFNEFGFEDIQLKVGRFEEFLMDGGKTISKSQIPMPKASAGADLQSVPTKNPQLTTPNFELRSTNYNLVYIDGNHQKEATLYYFEQLLSTIHNDSVMIFDDIHWSKGMEEAWEEIRQHPQVSVSIDTFQWGMVFFRREQEKEHFVIRT